MGQEMITGEHVILRPITDRDTDNIVRWRNSDHVRRNFIYQTLFTPESHREWLRDKVGTGIVEQFIIHSIDAGIDVGSVYLRDIDQTHRRAEFGIFIGEEAQMGHGIGSESIRLISRYGFEKLHLHKIFLRVLADNEIARKSYEKAGFMQEAYLKDEVCIRGIYKDLILMRMINPQEGYHG
ncbi:GNAT family protein [Lachnospiraceae bacterium JLR.KK008]